MKLDGVTPSHGPQGPDRTAGPRKAEPKAGGKSFADLLGKAQGAGGPPAGAPAAPADAASQAMPPMDPVARPNMGEPPADNHIETIRQRLQSGYYNNPKVDDALSDKLTGYFDDVV